MTNILCYSYIKIPNIEGCSTQKSGENGFDSDESNNNSPESLCDGERWGWFACVVKAVKGRNRKEIKHK